MAVRFVIEGDLRFISHHDTMRLFERALSRAQVPIRFSEGFNPRPSLSLPLPRPVGVASQAEVLAIELREPMEATVVLGRLARQMPAGLTLTEAWVPDDGRVPQADRVEYAVPIPPENAGSVAEAVKRLLAAETWRIERNDPGNRPARTIDLRTYLVDASIREGMLRWTLRVTPAGSARPAELLSAIGLAPDEWQHRVVRTAVHWLGKAREARDARCKNDHERSDLRTVPRTCRSD